MKLLMIENDAKYIRNFNGKQECDDYLVVSYKTIQQGI